MLGRGSNKQADVRRSVPTNPAKLVLLAVHVSENSVATTASIASVSAAPSAADMVERAKADIRSDADHTGRWSLILPQGFAGDLQARRASGADGSFDEQSLSIN